jgi:hypothetical protein
LESIFRARSFVDGNEQPTANIPKDIVEVEVGFLPESDVVDNLRKKDEIPEDDHPFIICEEVGESQVDEESEVELDVESCEFLPDELRVIHVGDVLAPPHEEQHLHIEDDEDHDIRQRREDEEKVPALRTHDVLDVRHRLREVLDIAQRYRQQRKFSSEHEVRHVHDLQDHIRAENLNGDDSTDIKTISHGGE